MLKYRQTKGFTLIELLVVVVIIGILAAIALPNFIGAQKKAKLSSVKANMHSLQMAAESYATDSGGNYSGLAAGVAPYLPGGTNTIGGFSGTFPTNPMTGAPNESPATCNASSTASILLYRHSQAASNVGGGTAGQISYIGIADNLNATINSSYAIMGEDDAAIDVMSNFGKMILSNQ
jgi:prepilin-type N-terminal cleavage/methylation domain-containing protein